MYNNLTYYKNSNEIAYGLLDMFSWSFFPNNFRTDVSSLKFFEDKKLLYEYNSFFLPFSIYNMDSLSLSSEMIIATTIIDLQNRFSWFDP